MDKNMNKQKIRSIQSAGPQRSFDWRESDIQHRNMYVGMANSIFHGVRVLKPGSKSFLYEKDSLVLLLDSLF